MKKSSNTSSPLRHRGAEARKERAFFCVSQCLSGGNGILSHLRMPVPRRQRIPPRVDLSLVQLVVKLKLLLTAFLVTRADVGLRQVVMGVRVTRFEFDSGPKLGDGFLVAVLVFK